MLLKCRFRVEGGVTKFNYLLFIGTFCRALKHCYKTTDFFYCLCQLTSTVQMLCSVNLLLPSRHSWICSCLHQIRRFKFYHVDQLTVILLLKLKQHDGCDYSITLFSLIGGGRWWVGWFQATISSYLMTFIKKIESTCF